MKGVERPLHSVFDHTADPATVAALRLAIVAEVYRFRQSHLAFGNITANQLGTGEFGLNPVTSYLLQRTAPDERATGELG